MADTAHRLTDEKLEKMEKRLSAIYSRAGKEIQQTADEYFSKFAKQDEAKRKLLEQGKITEEEYTRLLSEIREKAALVDRLYTGEITIDDVPTEWQEEIQRRVDERRAAEGEAAEQPVSGDEFLSMLEGVL